MYAYIINGLNKFIAKQELRPNSKRVDIKQIQHKFGPWICNSQTNGYYILSSIN